MKPFTEFLKHDSLMAGILLIFLFTWPFDMTLVGWLPFKVPNVIALTYGRGISVAALVMIALTLGREGVITLLQRFLIWRVRRNRLSIVPCRDLAHKWRAIA